MTLEKMKKGLTKPGMLLFLVNLLLWVVALFVVKPYYETNDDNVMAGIALGIMGEKDYHLVFINVIVGKIITILSGMLTFINAYTLVQSIVLFVSFSTIIFILSADSRYLERVFWSGLILLMFAYDFYHAMQFTKTAAAASIAGLLLFVFLIEKEEKRPGGYLWAGILMLLGSMYRFESFGMALIVGFFFVLVRFLVSISQKNKEKIKRYVICFAGAILLCLGAYALDAAVYNSDEGWKEYRVFNNERSELLDYGFPNLDANVELYQSIGWDWVTLANFQYWDFADPELFTTDVMEKLIAAKPHQINWKTVWENLTTDFVPYLVFTSFFAAIPLALLGLLFSGISRKNMLAGVGTILSAIFLELYLVMRGRYGVRHVDISIALYLVVILAFLAIAGKKQTEEPAMQFDRMADIVLILLTSFSCMLFVLNFQNSAEIQKQKEENEDSSQEEVTQLIYEDDAHFYFSKPGYGIQTFTDIWAPVEEGCSNNVCSIGDWLVNSPIYAKNWAAYDITHPYRNLINKPYTYLIDKGTFDHKLLFIRTKYASEAKMVLLKNLGGYSIYDFYIDGPSLDVASGKDDENLQYEAGLYLAESGIQMIQGFLYLPGTNSYDQRVYIGVQKPDGSPEIFYYTTQVECDERSEVNDGKYSGFYFNNEYGIDFAQDKVMIYLENEQGLYQVPFDGTPETLQQ